MKQEPTKIPLTTKVITNALGFLNRVSVQGFEENHAYLEVEQALRQLLNELQTAQIVPITEPTK